MESVLTENEVIIKNGEVVTIFNEETQRTGYMSVDECGRLLHEMVDKTRELLKQKNANTNKHACV